MTNFIYIFMIITLIGIGIGIRGFNSEDSDTKTTIKNIPRGLKKVLLIGENVHKVDMVILIGTIMYLLFTVGVVGIYLFANYKLKVHLKFLSLYQQHIGKKEMKQNRCMYMKRFIYRTKKKKLYANCFQNMLYYITNVRRI